MCLDTGIQPCTEGVLFGLPNVVLHIAINVLLHVETVPFVPHPMFDAGIEL